MQRGSQIRLNGYGDLTMTASRCCAQDGGHSGPWAVQVEIVQCQSAELAIAASARRASLAACGKSDPSQPG